MKKIFVVILLLATIGASAQIKIACVGNSITYGAGVENREKNSYPAQLQYMIGDKYQVTNFGVSARTLISKGDLPFVNTDEYKKSLESKSEIVLIKLGTNDLKQQNRVYLQDNFYNDCKKLIESYRAVNSSVRVILCKPLPSFHENFDQIALVEVVLPQIEQLAYDLNCELVNLYSIFDNKWSEVLMPDKLHPSSIGAGMIAQKIANVVDFNGQKPITLGMLNTEKFNFHGFVGINFKLEQIDCKLVVPKIAAKGNPWVIRARFWGHEPQLDIDLLENGFAIAYCDVANLYGSPKAVKRWNKLYDYMIKQGFYEKVVLEGFSRGGLIVYNWAAENQNKVECIYADAPVMDFMSWPVKRGRNEDVEQMLAGYNFKTIEQAIKWRKQPIDHAKKLVKIPIVHVVGDIDDVVPVAENTAVFEKKFKKNGGKITVIHKPNVGHHPHSLKAPKVLTDFILKACGRYKNYSVLPVPGNEYRSDAGWQEGADWHKVSDEIVAMLKNPTDILLLGNSITQGFGGERTLVTHKPGKTIADSLFGGEKWFAAGISGDKTQNLLWRLMNGNYGHSNPKYVVVMIGINNLAQGDDPNEVAQGINEIGKVADKEFPNAKIILLGVIPAGETVNDGIRGQCDQLHKCLARMDMGRVVYVNPTTWFVNSDGSLKTELYRSDNLHLGEKGYKVWCEKMIEMF